MPDNLPDVFEEAFQGSSSQSRGSEVTSQAALARWYHFGGDCIAGYPKELEDYNDDLTMRTLLQKVLTELHVTHPKQVSKISQEVMTIDSKLRAVLIRDAFPRFPESDWWLRNVPSYAGRAFCDELNKTYGIRIPARSRHDDDVDEMRRMSEGGMDAAVICIKARTEGWYSASRADLLFLACKEFLVADRRERRILWSWVNGEVSDQELAARLE